jgi:hypothetical protein
MWWTVPIGVRLGVGVGIGVGIKGGSWPEVLAWSTLTMAVGSAVTSARFWSAAGTGVRWTAPYVWGGAKALAGDSAIMGRAFATTRTAGALGAGAQVAAAALLGYGAGAVIGTAIISQAEKKEIVYEGATADVLDFYLLRGGTSQTTRVRSQWYESDVPILNMPGDVKFIASTYWNRWRA